MNPVALDLDSGTHHNRLALRSAIRISLTMGEIDALVPEPIGSPTGLAKRLQILGLFPCLVDHPQRDEYLKTSWDWIQKRVFKLRNEEAHQVILTALRERVVGPALVPFRREYGGSTLPVPGEFAKMRIPRYDTPPLTPITWKRFRYEDALRRSNSALGVLPLVAKVERYVGGAWEPAAETEVAFELRNPDPLPPFDPKKSALDQFARAPLPTSIEEVVAATEKKGMAPSNWDGSQRVLTDAKGEARIEFRPSGIGGDTYRFRVSAGPDVFVETGTLVLWRNIRISQYLGRPVSKKVLPVLVQEAAEYGVAGPDDYLNADMSGENALPVEPPLIDFGILQRKFATAFCELEFYGARWEREPIDEERYRRAFRIAKETGRQYLAGKRDLDVDALLLSEDEAANPASQSLLPIHTPPAYNRRIPDDREISRLSINEQKMVGEPDRTHLYHFLTECFKGFMRSVAEEGRLPGLTIVQTRHSVPWLLAEHLLRLGGVAVSHQGVFVWTSQVGAPPGTRNPEGDVTCTAAHEVGHSLGRPHATGGGAANADDEQHDDLESYPDNFCLMSYESGPAEFCAKCHFNLRGWPR